jgi:hypothetical protein
MLLWRTFESKREEVTKGLRSCIMTNLVICTLHVTQTVISKEDELDMACSMVREM